MSLSLAKKKIAVSAAPETAVIPICSFKMVYPGRAVLFQTNGWILRNFEKTGVQARQMQAPNWSEIALAAELLLELKTLRVTLEPLCSLHRRRCEAPLRFKPRQHWSMRVATRNHSKITKNAICSKIGHQSMVGGKITQEHSGTSQTEFLKLSGTFHFGAARDSLEARHSKTKQNLKLWSEFANIKNSNFEASPAPICSIFPEEFENSDKKLWGAS